MEKTAMARSGCFDLASIEPNDSMTRNRPMLDRMIFKLHQAAGRSNGRCQEVAVAILKKEPL